ncbi:MAG: NusG domain II-containing protein [Clostridia bacterium]|nr:NusG domain II-containing protein [Clostridia bacterium]
MKWRIADFIVIGVVFLSALLIWLYPALSETGATATITQDGVSQTVSLEKDLEIALENATVKIKDSRISITDARCPDLVCVKTGEISREGQSIVCVPNKIVITVGKSHEIDAISN